MDVSDQPESHMPKKNKSIVIIIAIIVVFVLFIIAIVVIYNKNPEEVNATFSDWSNWSGCSKPCGGGIQTRTRTCAGPNPTICNAVSPALLTDTQSCNTVACQPIFGDWGSCSKPCGGGTQTRKCWNCVGVPTSDISRPCNTMACPPTFSPWGLCSKPCDSGIQTRTCTNNCIGNMELSQQCNTFACPTISPWSPCSHTCGNGVETRTCTGVPEACTIYSNANPMSRPCNLGPCVLIPVTLSELTSHPWKMTQDSPTGCATEVHSGWGANQGTMWVYGGTGGILTCKHVRFVDRGTSSNSNYRGVSITIGFGPTFETGYPTDLYQYIGPGAPQDYVELKRGEDISNLGYRYKIYRDINDSNKLKIYDNVRRTTDIIVPV